MKIHTLKSRWFLPILSCAALSMSSQSNGAVIVEFEQVGGDVVATWTGTLALADDLWVGDRSHYSGLANSVALHDLGGAVEVYVAGNHTATSLSGTITSAVGFGGFNDTVFFFAGIDDNTAPAANIVFDFNAYTLSQTFAGQSLDDIGANNFSNTLAWTADGTGDAIRYTTVASVPEPSSSALVGLGALGMILRRRR